MKIKQLSDAEVTELYGGQPQRWALRMAPLASRIQDCASAGEFEAPKLLASHNVGPSEELQQVWATLRRIVLALRSFKAGPVGCPDLYMKAAQFFPGLGSVAVGHHGEYIPSGHYELSASEVAAFQAHAQQLARPLHAKLEPAIPRLADAEVRTSPRDKIVDAVIGLEAMLLHGAQQELSYRFSMNYASLFDAPEERHSKRRAARDMYRLRSTIVHGEDIGSDDALDIADGRLTLQQSAETACGMLREVIKRFLPEGERPGFCDDGYWERRILGLTTT